MKNWGKGKCLAAILLCLLLVFCCFSCKSEEEKAAKQAYANWNKASNAERMSIYCALIKEYMLLEEDLGSNTPYPAMKRNVKGYMITSGMTQDDAIAQAQQDLIVEQAVFWRSEQDGIVVSDAEVKAYIHENIIRQVAKDENYSAVSKACEAEGITFEDSIWAYQNSYKVDLICERAGLEDYEEVEAYKKESVERFKASDAYVTYKGILDTCAQLIRDNVTDKTTLKKAGIYY